MTGNIQANDCIGNLEHHIHKVFASIRVAGEEFVYCSSSELYSRLDDYCDDSAMGDMRPPVLIKGESGTGKTALLANWLQRREQLGIRMRNNADEFIFWHAVGCSRQSLNVNSMLRRLITDLKTKFELGRQVPKSQERLSWELPRFLELASKKGRVIIVIDGLHRLRLNDGSEDTLAWLPLTFPPNVRVILSVTVNVNKNIGGNAPNDNPVETFTPFMGGVNVALSPGRVEDKMEKLKMQSEGAKAGGKKSRIMSELDRRNIPSIVMRALDSGTCKSLVQAYIEKSINQEASKIAAGPFITSLLSEGKNKSDFIAGFLLFDSQLDTLLQHKLGGNPLFLRLFLRCLHFLSQRGYSLWSVFEDWILSTSVTDLMSRILKTCEQGYVKTQDHAQRDCDKSLNSGGMMAIRVLYPNHPAFRGDDLHSASDLLPITPFDKLTDADKRDGNDNDSMKSGGGMTSVGSKGFNRESMEEMGKKEATALSSQVLQNLGDQEWVNVEKLVQKQLHRALIDSRRSVEDIILQEGVGKERSQFMFDVISKIKQSQTTASRIDSAESSVVTYSHPNVLHRQRTSLFESGSNSVVSGGMSIKQDGDSNASSEDEADNWDDGSIKSVRKASPEFATPVSKSRPISEAPTPTTAKGTSNFVQHALVHGESIQFISTGDSPEVRNRGDNMVDPTEGFFSLPSYLRGGESVTGFGDLIGNALALLYVARQGLKEEELWKILGKLQLRKKQQQKSIIEKREAIANQEELMTKIARETLDNQGFLENAFMAEDIACRKYISMQKMYNAMKKALVDLKVIDYRQLVDFVVKNVLNGNAEEYLANFPGQPFVEDDHIHYEQFFLALKKLNRQFHFSGTRRETNNGNKSVMSPGANEEDDSDFENFHLPSRLTTAVGEEGRQTAEAGKDDEEDEGDEDNEDVRLGPVVEESLLEILCALGVLYSPENKVLILPSDSEPFRQTIYNRYILPRGGGSITYWHSLIIQYFRRQSNSLRKCEEMPWHLKICRKWSSLKDCLVDLKTFDLMFNNDLKDELMDYWRLLTEGPLYVIDPATLHAHSGGLGRSINSRGTFIPSLPSASNKGGNDDDDEDNQSTLSHVLREIDEAHVTRMSVKDIKRKMMRFQIQPFDAVEELNRSLEAWILSERPSPQWIYKTIMQISRFLLEFSKFTHSCPQFRRMGIDIAVLERFNLLFDEVRDVIGGNGSNDGVDEQTGIADGRGTTDVNATKVAPKSKDKYFEGSQKQDILRFPTPKMASGNLYLYLRWIWIQFPWLALHPAATVAIKNAQANDQLAFTTDESNEDLGDLNMVDESTKHLLRVWNVKKSDPTVPVFVSSLNRKLAAIKPRTSLSSNLERNVDASCKKLYSELTAPSHIAQVRLGIGLSQKDKFRRSWQQEVEMSKSIPFAYHGKRAMKSGSLFPSYNAAVKETNRKRADADFDDPDAGNKDGKFGKKKPLGKFNLDNALKNMLVAGSSAPQSSFFLTELDDEIRRISHDEYLHQHRTEAAANSLIKDETDLELVTLLDRISRMKSISNKLLIIQREKERSIEELENEIILRQESDTHLINEVENGEALIKSLHERNISMEKSLKEAKILQDGYMELLKALKMNPPYNEAHVQALEVEVELAKKQFDDLCVHRNKLYIEGEKLDHVRKRQLLERINYFQVARQEIAAKKKVVGKEVKHLKLNVGDKKSKEHRARDKEKNRRRREHHDGMHSDRSNSSDDSDSSKESLKDMTLTQPVIHFINALVRKVTYNEPIIKETDKSLDDVKKRAGAAIDVAASSVSEPSISVAEAAPAVNAPTNTVLMQNLMKKKGRMTEFHAGSVGGRKTVRGGESDSDSVTTSLHSQVGGGIPFRNNNYGGGMAIAPPSYNLSSKKKLTNDEITQLKDSIKSIVNVKDGGSRDNFKAQLQKALALMLQKTESNSFDEFLDRFVQGQNLLETLRSQQVLVDSRLAQLRAEHADLYSTWSDISFLAEEKNKVNAGIVPVSPNGSSLPASPSKDTVSDENSDRYLDNQLFAKEVRMHHYQRLFDKSVHVISEAKTAISHIMGLLKVNARLLSALPRSTAPDLQTDQDMVPCLSWCEDRIIALNEALTMDANRPNAGANEEKSKPMPQRQADLAEEIYKMVYEKKNRKSNYKGSKKQQGAMSKVLIVASDSKGFVSSPRNVVVPPAGKIDKLYDNKITKIVNERDRQVELTETQTFFSRDSSAQNEVQRFLQEGLDLKSTKDMTRQSKLLQNKRQGRQQSYGLVLEELMKLRGQTINLSRPGTSNKAEKNETATAERKEGGNGKEGETVAVKPGSAKTGKIV